MPYAPHFRLTLSGVIGTFLAPVEIFSFSVAIDNPNNEVAGPQHTLAALNPSTTYVGRPTTHIGDNAVLTQVSGLVNSGCGARENPDHRIGRNRGRATRRPPGP